MSLLAIRWNIQQLLPELDLNPDLQLELTGLTQDSRSTEPGDLFVARRGIAQDGRRFAQDAVARGAKAVLMEADATEALPELGVPVLRWDPQQLSLATLADRFFGSPSRTLRMIGYTGTNGKTSSAHFLVQSLNRLGEKTALIGTLGNGFLDQLESATHTTPDPISLQRKLAEYLSQGAQAVVMEVSSHAIDQGRIDRIAFDLIGYTNLTRDHLDYHGSEAAYAATKARLFSDFAVPLQLLNADDPACQAILQQPIVGAERKGFSLTDPNQYVALQTAEFRHDGMSLLIRLAGESVELSLPLLGRFNIANLMLVAGSLKLLGFTPVQIKEALAGLQAVEGRMQAIPLAAGPTVLIDYAHTPDALHKAILACREHLNAGRLSVLFGCGGDRDPGKRPMMAAIAEQGADQILVTSDNPRSEDPQAIIAEILSGLQNPAAAWVEVDRRSAIEQLIRSAQPGDILLLAGKGHESYQEINGVRHPFSDEAVARAALAAEGWL